MVVVGDVPSPWGEAAKGILHIKGIDWAAVRLAYDSEPLKEWAGQRSGPVAIYENERPRAGWAEILLLAERLAPTPSLLPADAAERALVFGLAHEICGEDGSGLVAPPAAGARRACRRPAASPSASRSTWARSTATRPDAGAAAGARVAELLRMLAARLKAQRDAGSRYYVGDALTAVDVYSATFMAHVRARCRTRSVRWTPARARRSQTRDAQTDAALDPILLEHRDRMYATHLELPLSL